MINEGAGEETIVEGKTVDEAVRKGLILSGWTKEQVTVEVLDPGSHGPWVNAGLARVRLSRRTANAFQLASEVTAGILRQVGLEGRARVEQRSSVAMAKASMRSSTSFRASFRSAAVPGSWSRSILAGSGNGGSAIYEIWPTRLRMRCGRPAAR